MEQHNFKRILHVLMLLGISYTHSKIYEEAAACFEHLIRNAELLNEKGLLPQIYHNMGRLQKRMQKPEQALLFFEKSLSFLDSKRSNYIVTLFSIGELKYFLDDKEEAKKCLVEVQELSRDQGVRKYKLLSSFYLMCEESHENAIEFLEMKVIPFLEDAKEHSDDLEHLYKLLSDHYTDLEMFEKAVLYLNKIH